MATELSLAEAFVAFGDFRGSVIRQIELSTGSDTPWRVKVELDASLTVDTPATPEGRYRVRFDFVGARTWRFWQGNWDMVVIIEAKWAHLDGQVYVGFDAIGLMTMNRRWNSFVPPSPT